MKLFEVNPDDDYPHDYDLNACHRWSLPGVKCEVCGWTGRTVSVAYPRLTLPTGIDPRPYEKGWPVTPSRIEELVAPLRPLLDPSLPIGAGTEFGPVCGTGNGTFGDFVWLSYSTPFISPNALEALRGRGIENLSSQSPDIKLRGKRRFEHLELCIEPRAELDPACLPLGGKERCPSCGIFKMFYDRSGWDEHPVILGSSFPADQHLARVREIKGLILATEHFASAVLDLKLTDIRFQEVNVTT